MMQNKLLGFGLLSALLTGVGYANLKANASECNCNPCKCGTPCPCQ
jgi:hypothetical protein